MLILSLLWFWSWFVCRITASGVPLSYSSSSSPFRSGSTSSRWPVRFGGSLSTPPSPPALLPPPTPLLALFSALLLLLSPCRTVSPHMNSSPDCSLPEGHWEPASRMVPQTDQWEVKPLRQQVAQMDRFSAVRSSICSESVRNLVFS